MIEFDARASWPRLSANEAEPAHASFDLDLLGALGHRNGWVAHTARSYREDLALFWRYLVETLGEAADPLGADPRRLRAYAAWLGGRYAPSTVARRLASLRSFYKFHRRRGTLAADPAGGLRNPKQPKRLPEPLRADQVVALLDSIPTDHPLGLRDRAMFETLYGGGLRVGELVGLDLADLDLGEGIARVRGKGRRERLAPLGPAATEVLSLWMAERIPEKAGEMAIFLNRYGRRLTARSVGRIFEGYLRGRDLDLGSSPPHLAPLVRDPPAGRRGRPPQRPGAFGPPPTDDHPDLHARQPGAAPRRLPRRAPPRLTPASADFPACAPCLRDATSPPCPRPPGLLRSSLGRRRPRDGSAPARRGCPVDGS